MPLGLNYYQLTEPQLRQIFVCGPDEYEVDFAQLSDLDRFLEAMLSQGGQSAAAFLDYQYQKSRFPRRLVEFFDLRVKSPNLAIQSKQPYLDWQSRLSVPHRDIRYRVYRLCHDLDETRASRLKGWRQKIELVISQAEEGESAVRGFIKQLLREGHDLHQITCTDQTNCGILETYRWRIRLLEEDSPSFLEANPGQWHGQDSVAKLFHTMEDQLAAKKMLSDPGYLLEDGRIDPMLPKGAITAWYQVCIEQGLMNPISRERTAALIGQMFEGYSISARTLADRESKAFIATYKRLRGKRSLR